MVVRTRFVGIKFYGKACGMNKFITILGAGLAIYTAITFTARADSLLPALPAPIENSAIVDAPIEDVWKAWTTSGGPPTFVCFGAEIEAKPGGVYRVICNVDGKTPLDRGNDGRVVAIELLKMLSVTWMTPMHMQSLRGNSTSLVLYFEKIDDGKRTRVRLVNSGYGVGPDWAEAYLSLPIIPSGHIRDEVRRDEGAL